MGYPAQVGMGETPQSVIFVTGSRNPLRWIYDAEQFWYDYGVGWRNLDGTYTEKGKQHLIDLEHAGLVKAGADPVIAKEQAAKDVTAVLKSNNADPSQTPFSILGDYLKWGGIGLGALLLILIVKD